MTLFFLRLFSRLPFGVLHAISGLVARLASDVVGYRRPVIRGNIEVQKERSRSSRPNFHGRGSDLSVVFPNVPRRSTGKLNACITAISRI